MQQGFRYQKIPFDQINNFLNAYEIYCGDNRVPWKLNPDGYPCYKNEEGYWIEGTPSALESWYMKIKSEYSDQVNSPKHYHAGPFEVIKVLKAWNITDFHLGNVIKYVARCGSKHDEPLEDLKKAQWYLNDKIKELENK